EYLKTDPGHPMAQLAVGRILYHLGDMPRFIAWIDQYRGQFKTFPGIFQAWHLEALHKLHRYEELTRWIKEYE
ncbi:MAG: hypothetical protein KGI83_07665, partial [Verrucomicrobiota bacterium]|nr:hypothetical protein [Verrucomicrobiota bacterium]